MASTANLRLRRSAAQLTALAGVEREIRAQDSHNRRKYLREFNEAFKRYESVLSREQLQETLRAADVILIGDYHALPAAQRCAASLLEQRALAGDRPVILGLETIFARDQHIVDEWWRREIEEAEFRQRIRFDLVDASPSRCCRRGRFWRWCLRSLGHRAMRPRTPCPPAGTRALLPGPVAGSDPGRHRCCALVRAGDDRRPDGRRAR